MNGRKIVIASGVVFVVVVAAWALFKRFFWMGP